MGENTFQRFIQKEIQKQHEPSLVFIFALALAVVLVLLIRPLVIEENAYRKIEGTIVNSDWDRMRWNEQQRRHFSEDNHHRIILNRGGNVFWVTNYQRDILREKAVVGKEATIWYRRRSARAARHDISRSRFSIVKMTIDNEVVIPFRRSGVVSFFFIGIIGSLLAACIIYIIKYLRQ